MALLCRREAAEAAAPDQAGPARSAGQRHENAARLRQRSGSAKDAHAEACRIAAQERFGCEEVTAAQDLLLLSVERV